MAAPTQTAANKSSLSMVSQNNDEDVALFSFLGVKIGAGAGEPNGQLTGTQKGDLFIRTDSPHLDMLLATTQDWEHVGDQT